jgi:hypothetical protein
MKCPAGAPVYCDNRSSGRRGILHRRIPFVGKQWLTKGNFITLGNEQSRFQTRVVRAAQGNVLDSRTRMDALLGLTSDRNVQPVFDPDVFYRHESGHSIPVEMAWCTS